MKKRSNAWMGWRPDTPDPRDHAFRPRAARLPRSIDLRARMPAVWNQGALGSCTGHAVGAVLEHARRAGGQPAMMPSRLMIYYNERLAEGTVAEDAGAEIRTGIKVVAKQGVCRERLWPYRQKRFAVRPPREAYRAARADLAVDYARVDQTLPALRAALAGGHPVVFGFACPESFGGARIARDGVLRPAGDEKIDGGHAVVAVGYDEARQKFLIRNSWGAEWGLQGHFWMPYGFMIDRNRCDDFWVIRRAN